VRLASIEGIRLSNYSVRLMVDVMRRAGVDAHAVAASSGIMLEKISDPRAEISGMQELAMQHAFVEATRQTPHAWFRAGLRYRLLSYGALGQLVLTAPTLSSAFAAVGKFQDLTFSLLDYQLCTDDEGIASLTADDSFVPQELRDFTLKRALGSVYTFLADLFQAQPPLQRIESPLPRPARWCRYAKFLPFPVEFDRDRTCWVFKPGATKEQLPMANPLLNQTYDQMCEMLTRHARAYDGCVARVLTVLSAPAAPRLLTAAETAAELNMSERTLHRRLEQRGLKFGQLRDQMLVQRARALLDNTTLSVAQIAEQLGFAETSSFSRAFKRLSDIAPAEYRARRSS